MIDREILPITSELLRSEEPDVREQAAKLLGSFALSAIGRQLFDYAFPNLRSLLEDEELQVRTAAAWALKQLTVNKDGCERVVESKVAEAMIDSFIKHSSSGCLHRDDAEYLVQLLEGFVNLTQSDIGIEPLLGKNAIDQFTKILEPEYCAMEILQNKHKKIAELCLRVLGNMSINHEGKEECIVNKVIERSYTYLIAGPGRSYEDALNTSLILMSCSIHLQGKQQIIELLDMEENPVIIQAIVNRLKSHNYPNLRNNLKIVLTNVAELPKGFSDITL